MVVVVLACVSVVVGYRSKGGLSPPARLLGTATLLYRGALVWSETCSDCFSLDCTSNGDTLEVYRVKAINERNYNERT